MTIQAIVPILTGIGKTALRDLCLRRGDSGSDLMLVARFQIIRVGSKVNKLIR